MAEARSLPFRIEVAAPAAARFLIPAVLGADNTRRTFDGSESDWPLVGGGTAQPVPGDIIELEAGEHGPLEFRNLFGTESARITIRGPQVGSEQAVIRRPLNESGNFVLLVRNAAYLTIDGYLPALSAPDVAPYRCGIKVTYSTAAVKGLGKANKDGPSAFIKFSGLVCWTTVQYVEVDGGWEYAGAAVDLAGDGQGWAYEGIGISGHDNELTAEAGTWYDGNKYLRNYVHHAQGEGLYIGSNYSTGAVPQRNIETAHNRIVETGGGAIHSKCFFEGDNRVHHNVCLRVGYNAPTPSRIGLTAQGSTVRFYNNWIEEIAHGSDRLNDASGGRPDGIQLYTISGPPIGQLAHGVYGPYTTFAVWIYNNVIVRCGNATLAAVSGNESHGIAVGRGDSSYCGYTVYAFNNTIVGSSGRGLSINDSSPGSFIKNTISAGNASNDYTTGLEGYSATDNETSAEPAAIFEDPSGSDRSSSFALQTAIPAVGVQSADGPVALTDYLDAARPPSGADMGAYERL